MGMKIIGTFNKKWCIQNIPFKLRVHEQNKQKYHENVFGPTWHRGGRRAMDCICAKRKDLS